MKKQFVYFTILLVFILHFILSAQTSKPDTLDALYINEQIELDGELEESAWEKANKISNFTQRELQEGQPATETTEVAILYNDTHLYIGLWAFDSEPGKIIAKESKRDFSWQSEDNFEIILGPFNDNRNGYLFVINPNGAMADVMVADEGNGFNMDWNGVWQAEVEIDDEGWFAEIEIPFSTFKFPDTDEQIWALNMERNIRRKNEQVLWQGWSRDQDLEKISHAGKLAGLKHIRSASPWELKPFINIGVEKEKSESILAKIKLGGDINYLITPKMKLNFTFNTDFSQVESDREEINLTRFSLFYPEKREFFLEGKSLFEFNLSEDAQVFYSRRIGLHERKQIPIIGGARLIGRAGGTNLGFLSIQGAEKDTLPTSNFSVIRLKQDIFKQSNIGLIFTSKNNSDNYNYVYGFDANYATSNFLDNKNFEMGAAVSQSYSEHQTNKNNLGYKAYIAYPNDLVEFNLNTITINQNFNPEMGFLHRQDYRLYYSNLVLKPRPVFIPFIKNFEIIPIETASYFTDHNHKLESMEMEFRPFGAEFKSGDNLEFNIQRFFDRLDEDFEILDEVEIPEDSYWFTRFEFGLESFEGRQVFTEVQYSWGDFYTGKRQELEAALGWNIQRRLNISVDWEHNYIQLDDENFNTDEIGSRIEYAFNPNLNSSVFGQWNNEDDEVLLNYRINWLPTPGSYFYFVVNQKLSTQNNSIELLTTTVILKLIWRFSF